MKIRLIKVRNFRLLKDFSIDLEDQMSLVIGKNNCWKTSLLSILEKFLNKRSDRFSYDDFNVDFRSELESATADPSSDIPLPIGISLSLFIEYDLTDNLARLGDFIMDLDPRNNTVVIHFEYSLSGNSLLNLRNDFVAFATKCQKEANACLAWEFLRDKFSRYFEITKKSVAYDMEKWTEDFSKVANLDKDGRAIEDIIHFRYIRANRDVSNKEPDKSLSYLSSKIYDKIQGDSEQTAAIEQFKETLKITDKALGETYGSIFHDVVGKVRKFGWTYEAETNIKITSTLQHQELLKGNTTVVYEHESHSLPESYNWLGYMNLISMIFEIEIAVNDFREKAAQINLLFIEEPEAHTHPQMQYAFIRNIKTLLHSAPIPLQSVISTHSSHIVAESDFDEIKYLVKKDGRVTSKNLKDLKAEYSKEGDDAGYKFLKQYLTLHRAELFFADKAIFIEGDTERILLPAMMKKIDQADASECPLLSQNISIIEVWNYSHKFEKFIDFIWIKWLIITDIDSASSEDKKARPADSHEADITTNSSLAFFFWTDQLSAFKDKVPDEMLVEKVSVEWSQEKIWKPSSRGTLLCACQTTEVNDSGESCCGRSFEESFFHMNRKFIIDCGSVKFPSIKKFPLIEDASNSPYKLADECIGRKPQFAMEILINSAEDSNGNEFSNWKTPSYIENWLKWLKG